MMPEQAFVKDPFLPPGRTPPPRSAPPVEPAPAVKSGTVTGSLVVIGTGVMAVNQVTIEGQRRIEQADKVICFDIDPVTECWIRTLNDKVEAGNGTAERLLEYLRAGLTVCAVSNDHRASHELMERARSRGYRTALSPGVSVLDCLFSDLGLDPFTAGCQMYDAADFVARRRQPDVSTGMILWRVSRCHGPLVETLAGFYGDSHEVILYEPAQYAVCDPIIRRYPIGQLAEAAVTAVSSVYVPPR